MALPKPRPVSSVPPASRPADLAIYPPSVDTAKPEKSEVQVWDSIEKVDVEAWDAVRDPQDLFMDVRLLRVVEQTMAADARFRYALFRGERGRPMAIACLCTYTVDGTLLADPGLFHWLLEATKKVCPDLLRYRILFCGLPFSSGQSHLRFAPGADHREILATLDSMLRDIAARDRARCIVLKEFDEAEIPALASAECDLGYRRADSLPMNIVRPRHRTFEDYVASLPNRKRHDLRRAQRKFDAAGFRLLTTSDPDEVDRLYTDEVHRMYEAVVSRSHSKLELLPAGFFREMVRQLPNHAEFIFAFDGAAVVGFGLTLYSDREALPLFCGVDYSRNEHGDVYCNMLYRLLDDSFRHRVCELKLGQNADHCKAVRLGSFQVPRYFYIKGVGYLMERLIGLLFRQLFPPRPITMRAEEHLAQRD